MDDTDAWEITGVFEFDGVHYVGYIPKGADLETSGLTGFPLDAPTPKEKD